MDKLTTDEFINRFMGAMSFGLPADQAKALVDMGNDVCDYFEKTAIATFYPDYEKSPLTTDQWAINHPLVNLDKYLKVSDNKEALKSALDYVVMVNE